MANAAIEHSHSISLATTHAHKRPQLPPQRCDSQFSAFSAHSSTTNIPHNQLTEAPDNGRLPSFWSPYARELTSSPTKEMEGGRWKRAFKGWRVVAFGSWLNVLLISIPISWGLGIALDNQQGLVFAFCILAFIPLVRLHDLSSRELAIRIGGSKTGLLNASMSNIVEIVVAISALRKCELRVVQSALIGSILSKLLLVLGLCFLAGGMRFSEQGFDATATQIHSSLLSISVGAVLLPAAYHFTLSNAHNMTDEIQTQNILHMSHGVAIILLFIYASYLIFQLWSHTHLYNDRHNKKSSRLSVSVKVSKDTSAIFRSSKRRTESVPMSGSAFSSQSDIGRVASTQSFSSFSPLRPPYAPYMSSSTSSEGTLSSINVKNGQFRSENPTVRLVGGRKTSVPMGRWPTSSEYSSTSSAPLQEERNEAGQSSDTSDNERQEEIEVKRQPQLSWFMTFVVLILVTVAVSVTADALVESMDAISSTIRKEWIGLILLPAISSIAECMTAVRVSVKDELSLSISVAVGSTIQTSLFVIPVMVLLAWATDKPLSLLMDPFQSMVLYLAVQTMSYVVADGKSNWLEGVILVSTYVIIAVSFWFYPGSPLPHHLAKCAIH